MTIDEKIDKIIDSLKDEEGVQIWGWVAHVLRENSREYEQSHDVLVETMRDKGLIVAPNYKNPGFFKLTSYGHEIAAQGGWIKFLYDSMREGEKIHRLLKFVVDSGSKEFEWTPESLSLAFNDKLDNREIRHLCQRLIDASDAISLANKDYFAIGITEASISAYYSKKYLKSISEKIPVTNQTSIHIGNSQHISGSTINGNVIGQSWSTTSHSKTESQWSLRNFVIKHLWKILTGTLIGLIVAFLTGILKWKV